MGYRYGVGLSGEGWVSGWVSRRPDSSGVVHPNCGLLAASQTRTDAIGLTRERRVVRVVTLGDQLEGDSVGRLALAAWTVLGSFSACAVCGRHPVLLYQWKGYKNNRRFHTVQGRIPPQ